MGVCYTVEGRCWEGGRRCSLERLSSGTVCFASRVKVLGSRGGRRMLSRSRRSSKMRQNISNKDCHRAISRRWSRSNIKSSRKKRSPILIKMCSSNNEKRVKSSSSNNIQKRRSNSKRRSRSNNKSNSSRRKKRSSRSKIRRISKQTKPLSSSSTSSSMHPKPQHHTPSRMPPTHSRTRQISSPFASNKSTDTDTSAVLGPPLPQWKRLLKLTVEMRARALVDSGALMAGVSNLDAAKYALELLPAGQGGMQGVVYFDERQWRVLDRLGRRFALHSSPVREQDAFVFFDESRCRGADLKLPQDAVAVVTLGPRMCKDKLMQAAGRMRLLGKHQRLILCGAEDVSHSIVRDAVQAAEMAEGDAAAMFREVKEEPLTPIRVLNWVIRNTVEATAFGLPEWASQGAFFCVSKVNPSLATQDEHLELEALYGPASTTKKMGSVISDSVSTQIHRLGRQSSGREELRQHPVLNELVGGVTARCAEYGADFELTAATLDEECERELEKEVEEEQQREVQVAAVKPRNETDWEYSAVSSASSLLELRERGAPTLELGKALGSVLSATSASCVCAIRWCDSVHCTPNFLQSIQSTSRSMDSYLRPVDTVLVWHDPAGAQRSSYLLISDREAEFIIPLLLSVTAQQGAPQLQHLSFLRQACSDSQVAVPLRLPYVQQELKGQGSEEQLAKVSALASMQLFNGDTMYATQQRNAALRELLGPVSPVMTRSNARMGAVSLLKMRGLLHMFARSELEEAVGVHALAELENED